MVQVICEDPGGQQQRRQKDQREKPARIIPAQDADAAGKEQGGDHQQGNIKAVPGIADQDRFGGKNAVFDDPEQEKSEHESRRGQHALPGQRGEQPHPQGLCPEQEQTHIDDVLQTEQNGLPERGKRGLKGIHHPRQQEEAQKGPQGVCCSLTQHRRTSSPQTGVYRSVFILAKSRAGRNGEKIPGQRPAVQPERI